jgi:hypothetical protein
MGWLARFSMEGFKILKILFFFLDSIQIQNQIRIKQILFESKTFSIFRQPLLPLG